MTPPHVQIKFKGVKVRCCSSLVVKLCLTLCNPMDCSPPGSPVCGIFPARILEWATIFFSRGSIQGLNPCLLHWQVGSLPLSHQGSPIYKIKQTKMYFPFYLSQIELSLFQILSA